MARTAFRRACSCNDACVKQGSTIVHGSIYRFARGQRVCWVVGRAVVRDDLPGLGHHPAPGRRSSRRRARRQAGAGVLPGVVGTLEAIEVIKLLLGIGDPFVGRLPRWRDALAQRFTDTRKVDANPDCAYCAEGRHDSSRRRRGPEHFCSDSTTGRAGAYHGC